MELQKNPPPLARRRKVPALIREGDSTWLKARRRGRRGPVRHFQVPLGLHDTGRHRRDRARGSTGLRLQNKQMLVSTAPLVLLGRQCQLLAHRRFAPEVHLLVSDAEEGLKRLRQNEFPHRPWLLDRWHIARAVRALTGPDQDECHRLMRPVWNADSQGVLEALRTNPSRHQRPEEFQALWG